MLVRNLEEGGGCVFSLELWNINRRILEDVPRTTNSVEGGHRSLNSDVVIAHPNLIRLILAMKGEEEGVRTKLKRLTPGVEFPYLRCNLQKKHQLKYLLKYKNVSIDWGFHGALGGLIY